MTVNMETLKARGDKIDDQMKNLLDLKIVLLPKVINPKTCR